MPSHRHWHRMIADWWCQANLAVGSLLQLCWEKQCRLPIVVNIEKIDWDITQRKGFLTYVHDWSGLLKFGIWAYWLVTLRWQYRLWLELMISWLEYNFVNIMLTSLEKGWTWIEFFIIDQIIVPGSERRCCGISCRAYLQIWCLALAKA